MLCRKDRGLDSTTLTSMSGAQSLMDSHTSGGERVHFSSSRCAEKRWSDAMHGRNDAPLASTEPDRTGQDRTGQVRTRSDV